MNPLFPGKNEMDQLNRIFKVSFNCNNDMVYVTTSLPGLGVYSNGLLINIITP